MSYSLSLTPKLIYVFRINDESHSGCLKIGDTTAEGDVSIQDLLMPNCKALNVAAKRRIDQYTRTAGIPYELLYTELSIYFKGKEILAFRDSDVHDVLKRSGIKQKVFDPQIQADEWYITDLETVKKAIAAVKSGKAALHASEISIDHSPIIFRPEQREAIEKTKKQFKKNTRMLWNAKMRFGKTLSALQVVKDMDFSKTLILTHRPVVNDGWFDDFQKIFYDRTDFAYGSKFKGETFHSLEQKAKKHGLHYVYFASMQDLRGSEKAGGKFDKNDGVFAAGWNLIIVDEAHEGTQTELGKNVMRELTKEDTRVLRLSGTPFNMLDDYREEEIFTWDYVMEQKAKKAWDATHHGDPNPYGPLPRMNIFTFDLGKQFANFADEELAFNFHEFFRVDESGVFIHKKDVQAFLNLICKMDETSCYPYSTQKYRDNFRHSLWMVPGVKEAKALSALLQAHNVFGQFRIVNVAGEGDEDVRYEDSLKMVKDAIGSNLEKTYTITLSCGRLTTGVSVPAWTAVFMLAGSFNTSATSYMQTIFRVQTPATINGKVKTEAFVFDFAPDRTLKVIAETAKVSAKVGKTTGDDRKIIGEFLNFCPVIAVDGTRMKDYNVDKMLEQLKKVYVERVVRNGFEDGYLYNNDMLMKLDGVELEEFDGLKAIIGSTKAMPKSGDIDVNNQGFKDEEYEQVESAEGKKRKKQELTEDEKRLLEEKKKKKENRDSAISILRGISIRMPLMIYGAELKDESQEITIDNFTELIDPQSWEEFMPRGVSKQKFNSFKKYYEPDVFRAAGRRIRAMAKAADSLSVEERIERITAIFNTFRNPDKETVLTPWRVVNMHMSDCIGGWTFFDDKFETQLQQPRFVDQGKVTAEVFKPTSHILEINSKSGLYPLYMAYSVYRTRRKADDSLGMTSAPSLESMLAVWDKAVAENIFVICKTPMAKSITKRTLCGFRNSKVNAHYFENLVNILKNKSQQFIDRVTKRSYWNLSKGGKMKFDAIVGNPPYQINDGGGTGASAMATYNYFVEQAKELSPQYVSMIIPSRWFTGGKGLDNFRNSMLKDKRLEMLVDFPDSRKCFPFVDIAGGVCYFRWTKDYLHDKCLVTTMGNTITSKKRILDEFNTFIRDVTSYGIIKKVQAKADSFMDSVVLSRNPFGIDSKIILPLDKGTLSLIYKDGVSPFPISKLTRGLEIVDKWKVIVSKTTSEHAGQASKDGRKKVVSRVEVLPPQSICSETYLVMGCFEQKQKAVNLVDYIRTKFFRLLILVTALTQNLAKDTFSFVPIQDFTESWTDEKLYKKYGLSDDEIAFIESSIKPME